MRQVIVDIEIKCRCVMFVDEVDREGYHADSTDPDDEYAMDELSELVSSIPLPRSSIEQFEDVTMNLVSVSSKLPRHMLQTQYLEVPTIDGTLVWKDKKTHEVIATSYCDGELVDGYNYGGFCLKTWGECHDNKNIWEHIP